MCILTLIDTKKSYKQGQGSLLAQSLLNMNIHWIQALNIKETTPFIHALIPFLAIWIKGKSINK
jgi:hypothetical protein